MTHFTLPEDKFIPAHYLPTSLIDLAAMRGVNPQKLIKGTGIFVEDICSGEVKLSALQVFKLVEKAQQLVPGYDSSFLLGQRLLADVNSPLAQALNHSRTVADYLRILWCYQDRLNPFIDVSVHRSTDYISLYLNDVMGCGHQYSYLLETYLTALSSSLKFLCAEKVKIEYQFRQSRPKHIQEYEVNLGSNIQFEQAADLIKIPRATLKCSLSGYSPLKREYALFQLKQQTNNKTLIQLILKLFSRYGAITLEETAMHLNMSPATLKRKLKQHKTRFLALQDLYNKQQVMKIIQSMPLDYTNEDIAGLAGFSDLANFRRTFKRWFTMTPSEFKAKYT